MTQSVEANSHRALPHTAGDARAYAEALLVRLCRQWGFPREELYQNHKVGRRRGKAFVRQAIIATFLRDIDEHKCMSGEHESHGEGVSAATLAELCGIDKRNVHRYLGAIRVYSEVRQQRSRGSMSGQPKEPVNIIRPSGDLALTGFDRGSLEEMSDGGYAP